METQSVNLKISVPRGMLFVYDQSGSNVEIPSYSKENTVATSDTAISIATISDLDGEVEIFLADSEISPTKTPEELFSGLIFSENGKLNICIMGDESIACIYSEKGSVKISIYGDRTPFPKSISIFVHELTAD